MLIYASLWAIHWFISVSFPSNDFKYHLHFTERILCHVTVIIMTCTVLLYTSKTCLRIINWYLALSWALSFSSCNIYCLPSNVTRLLYRSHAIAQYASNEYIQRLKRKIRDLWLVHVRRRRGGPGLDQGNGSLYAILHSAVVNRSSNVSSPQERNCVDTIRHTEGEWTDRNDLPLTICKSIDYNRFINTWESILEDN